MAAAAAAPMASMRRRSFSRSKEDNTPPSEQIEIAEAQAKAKEERRNDAARRFSLTGMVDLAEFANVPFDLELVPLLPWSLDAAAPRDADGFPSASVARASLVALLLRSVPELIFAVVSIARSERLEITAAMNVVLTVADLAKVLVARCAFRPSGCIARRVHRRSPPATKIPERGRGADAARAEYVDVHRRITKHRVRLPVTDDPPGFPVGPDAFDFELDDGPTP